MNNSFKKLFIYFLVYLVGGFPSAVYAMPRDAQIAAGSGTISQPDANNMVINQSTDQMITNWGGFSIGSAESVRFNQPGASSTALNRVTGQDPSVILGKLSSNGQIFLSNPSGVIFGQGARVNVGGILATTLKISDQDFLNRNYRFFQDPGKPLASILNEGTLNASTGGFVGLLAPSVENRGSIFANLGSVAIATGKEAALDFTGDGLINFSITKPVDGIVLDRDGNQIQNLLSNSGTIQANGGQVTLSASAVSDIVRNVVNNTGVIEANTVVQKGGRIFLEGGDTGIVANSGVLSARGDDEGETGGTVHVLGNKVGLTDSGSIDVSGDAGGGTALIGGDYQGKNPDIQNAQVTYISELASIDASAFTNGDGGKVIVWANGTTRFYGAISATGGAVSGSGGFAEVSGKQYLDFQGIADLGAANGTGGTLLLDPMDLYITDDATAEVRITGFSGTDYVESWTDDSNTLDSYIRASTLEAVPANSTIQLQAVDDIWVNSAINITNDNVNLELDARNGLTVSADISTTGWMFLYADEDGAVGFGALGFTAGVTLTSTSGEIQLRAGLNEGNWLNALGDLTINAANGVSIRDDVVAAGAVTINADTDGNGGLFDFDTGEVFNAQGNALSITADTMTIYGTLQGTSTLTLQPSADATTIGIGGGTGTFNLDAAEIGRFTNGFSSITIGRSTGTGAVDQNAVTFNDPLTIQGGAMVMDNLSMGSNAITLVSTSTIDDADTDATNITTTGTLTLTSNGAIGETSVLGIDVGTVTLTSSGGNNVLITDQGTSDTIYNVTTGGAGNLTLTQTASNMILGTSAFSTTGNLAATSTAGTITDGGTLTVGGTASFTASTGGQSITLNNTNIITGAVSFTTSGAGDVTFDNGTTALDLGTVSVGQNLAITSGEAITDSGVITVGGTASFTTDVADKSITLDSSNAITGTVTLSTSGTGGDVTFDNGSTALALPTISAGDIGGDLTVTTSGATTISNAISLDGGALSITVSGANNLTVNAALSTSAANGAMTLNAGSGTLTTGAGGTLASGSGAITLTADAVALDGTVTGTGALTVQPSTVSTTIGTGGGTGDFNLTDAEIAEFTDGFSSITIGASSGTGAVDMNAVTFNDPLTVIGGAMVVDSLTMGSNSLTLTSSSTVDLASVTTTGSLGVTASGAITDSGALSVSGTATFAAGSGNDITLDQTSNNFSVVSITSGNNVTLYDTDAIDLGASTVSGTFDVTSSGAITDSGALTVAGTATFAAGSGNDITLDSSNDFSTVVITSGNNVSLTDSGAIDLGASTVSGTLGVTASGAITNSGALSVTGTATLAAGSGNDITLDQTSNNFSVVSITSGNNVTLYDTDAIDLGASTVSGTFDVTSSGAITDSGALTVAGTATFTAGSANDITLDHTSNDFSTNTVLIVSANNVSLYDAGAIGIGASTFSGTLTVTSAGAVNISGDITSSGASNITIDSGGTITISGDVTTAGGDISFTNAVVLGSSVTISTGSSGGGSVTFSGTVDGTTSGTENLTLIVGTGNASLIGALGSIVKVGDVSISTTGTVTPPDSILAVSVSGLGSDAATANDLSNTIGRILSSSEVQDILDAIGVGNQSAYSIGFFENPAEGGC